MRKGVESGDSPGGSGDGCEGGNGCATHKMLCRWKAGASGTNHASVRPRVRFRQDLAEAQPSAGLMPTSVRSRIAFVLSRTC